VNRQRTIWWLGAGILLLFLLALNFLSFQLARSITGTDYSVSTYRSGADAPKNMAPGLTLYYRVNGEGQVAAELETALHDELAQLPSAAAVMPLSESIQNQPAPLLQVDLALDRLWTPVYARATLTAQIYFAYDGDAPWPLDEPIVLQESPAVKADGEFTLVDTTWGLISKPAYTEHLAQALAEAIAKALDADVFPTPE